MIGININPGFTLLFERYRHDQIFLKLIIGREENE